MMHREMNASASSNDCDWQAEAGKPDGHGFFVIYANCFAVSESCPLNESCPHVHVKTEDCRLGTGVRLLDESAGS
jgi:hypothetical protein